MKLRLLCHRIATLRAVHILGQRLPKLSETLARHSNGRNSRNRRVRKSERTLARDFPRCVEIVVPIGGFGRTPDLMHARLHSIAHVGGRGRREGERDITRWRFARREDAEAFANAFGSVVVSLVQLVPRGF
jgi:hypothetical protein